MRTVTLTDSQWQKILPFLHSCPNVYVGHEEDCRKFVEAVLWITRSGAQWRLLPAQHGDWNAVYKRFSGWAEKGVFEQLHQHFADDADMEHLLTASTVIRAHSCSAGAPKKKAVKIVKPEVEVVAGFQPRFISPLMRWASPPAISFDGRQSSRCAASREVEGRF